MRRHCNDLPPFMRHPAMRSKHPVQRRGGAACVPIACFALASFASAQTEANLELRSLAASCAACHGTDGHSAPTSSLPSLAHLRPEYFIERMRAFREDPALRSNVMAQIAKGYDTQQVEQLATYFANQP
jgi:cytochrome c553